MRQCRVQQCARTMLAIAAACVAALSCAAQAADTAEQRALDMNAYLSERPNFMNEGLPSCSLTPYTGGSGGLRRRQAGSGGNDCTDDHLPQVGTLRHTGCDESKWRVFRLTYLAFPSPAHGGRTTMNVAMAQKITAFVNKALRPARLSFSASVRQLDAPAGVAPICFDTGGCSTQEDWWQALPEGTVTDEDGFVMFVPPLAAEALWHYIPYARFPWDNRNRRVQFPPVHEFREQYLLQTALHELGHCLGLLHTFEDQGCTCSSVNGTLSQLDGDGIDDTYAAPNPFRNSGSDTPSCENVNREFSDCGNEMVRYNNWQTHNCMSYTYTNARCVTGERLTAGQISTIRCTLEDYFSTGEESNGGVSGGGNSDEEEPVATEKGQIASDAARIVSVFSSLLPGISWGVPDLNENITHSVTYEADPIALVQGGLYRVRDLPAEGRVAIVPAGARAVAANATFADVASFEVPREADRSALRFSYYASGAPIGKGSYLLATEFASDGGDLRWSPSFALVPAVCSHSPLDRAGITMPARVGVCRSARECDERGENFEFNENSATCNSGTHLAGSGFGCCLKSHADLTNYYNADELRGVANKTAVQLPYIAIAPEHFAGAKQFVSVASALPVTISGAVLRAIDDDRTVEICAASGATGGAAACSFTSAVLANRTWWFFEYELPLAMAEGEYALELSGSFTVNNGNGERTVSALRSAAFEVNYAPCQPTTGLGLSGSCRATCDNVVRLYGGGRDESEDDGVGGLCSAALPADALCCVGDASVAEGSYRRSQFSNDDDGADEWYENPFVWLVVGGALCCGCVCLLLVAAAAYARSARTSETRNAARRRYGHSDTRASVRRSATERDSRERPSNRGFNPLVADASHAALRSSRGLSRSSGVARRAKAPTAERRGRATSREVADRSSWRILY